MHSGFHLYPYKRENKCVLFHGPVRIAQNEHQQNDCHLPSWGIPYLQSPEKRSFSEKDRARLASYVITSLKNCVRPAQHDENRWNYQRKPTAYWRGVV